MQRDRGLVLSDHSARVASWCKGKDLPNRQRLSFYCRRWCERSTLTVVGIEPATFRSSESAALTICTTGHQTAVDLRGGLRNSDSVALSENGKGDHF